MLRTNLAGVNTKWYFNPADSKLLGYEVSTDREDDPCENHFSDYKKDSCGKELPGRIKIKYCDKEYASFKVDGWKLEYQFNSGALQKRYLSCLQLSFKNLKMPSL